MVLDKKESGKGEEIFTVRQIFHIIKRELRRKGSGN